MVIFKKNAYSYKDLLKGINSLASELLSLGIKRGDYVAILLPNCPEFIISFFANWQIGAVSVPLDTRLNIEELNRIFRKLRITAVITNSHLLQAAQNIHAKPRFIIVKGKTSKRGEFPLKIDKMSTKAAHFMETLPENRILCQLSSGSTGSLKFIHRTGKSLLEEARSFSFRISLNHKDRVLCILPLSHSYALGTIALSSIFSGAALFLEQGFLPVELLELTRKNKITVFPATPFIYEILTRTYPDGKVDLNTLRLCISSGAPLRENTFVKFKKLYNKKICQLYGSTETGAVSINYPFNERKIGSVGRPLAKNKIKIVQDEILWGTVRTGDLGKIDERGYLYILGRKDDVINVAGSKVYPQEVEKVILAHSKVKEAVVVGVDYAYGQLIKAVVVPEGKVTSEEIIRYCREKLTIYKVPRIIELRKELPRTVTGKIVRNRLRSS
ncbi:MAG: class I adenylate-forming enzyme family protein [Candidatus Kappaea frigidicola]|nr:class I adenylate-forming enzyme family protein [Candidatus Kappaea frigidicola]